MINHLLERIGRIIRSNINSLFEDNKDSDPKTMVTKAISEIDAAVEEIRSELGRIAAARHGAARLEKKALDESLRLDIRIKSALKENDDNAAAAAAEKQIKINAHHLKLKADLTLYDQTVEELEHYLTTLLAQKHKLSTALTTGNNSLLKKNPDSDEISYDENAAQRLQEKIEKAHLAFERVGQSLNHHWPNENDGPTPSHKLKELEEMAVKAKVEKHLMKLKKRMNKYD